MEEEKNNLIKINKENNITNKEKHKQFTIAKIVLIALTALVIGFNAMQISQLSKAVGTAQLSGAAVSSKNTANTASSNINIKGIDIDVIPKGVPAVYGREIGVSFDDISPNEPQKVDAAIKKLGAFDEGIELSGEDLKRYTKIGTQISCEYCCGAEAIIFSNGKAACGCAHSYAMRGLAKYLIKNHGKEYTNEQILEEMGKWKTLFFPKQLAEKAKVLKEKNIEINYINLASNKYRGVEKEVSGGMVGGC